LICAFIHFSSEAVAALPCFFAISSSTVHNTNEEENLLLYVIVLSMIFSGESKPSFESHIISADILAFSSTISA
jgi:hypothetical protein